MGRLSRILPDKRAITPVLSNLLLMVVAVAAMSIAATATYVITTNLRETMSERIVVEDLWFNPSTNKTMVYVHNVGKVSVQVSAVYINHISWSFTPSPLILEIGEHCWFNITRSWNTGSIYYIDIITTRGTHVGGYYKAP